MPEGHQTGILSLMPCKLNVERFTAVVVAQLLSRVSLRPYRLQHARLLCPPLSPSLLFNHLILCHSLFPLSSVFPSISLSQWVCIRRPKHGSVSISPSSDYSELISFRVDWFELLAVQGTQESSPEPQFKKHQFFDFQPSLGTISYFHMWLPLLAKWCLCFLKPILIGG